VLRRVAAGSVVWKPQDTSAATYAEKLRASDVALEPSLSVEQAYRRVRASGRHAPSRAVIGTHSVVLRRAEPTTADAGRGAGTVDLRDGELLLGFADGLLRVERLVPAGRKPMSGRDFVRGARLPADARWGSG
jgi:methionyl-tRNA formyltransferase